MPNYSPSRPAPTADPVTSSHVYNDAAKDISRKAADEIENLPRSAGFTQMSTEPLPP